MRNRRRLATLIFSVVLLAGCSPGNSSNKTATENKTLPPPTDIKAPPVPPAPPARPPDIINEPPPVFIQPPPQPPAPPPVILPPPGIPTNPPNVVVQPPPSPPPPASNITPPSPPTAPDPTPPAPTPPVPTKIPPSGTPVAIPVTQLQWTKAGGPIGGLGYDVKMRPDNPERMFVTDAWTGVNYSFDGGKTWAAWNNGITSNGGPSGDAIPVFSLAVSPQNPDVVWCGTQGLRGIFKSTDGGKTWVKKDNGVVENEGLSLRGFTVDPKDINTVYASAEIASWAWTPNHEPQNGFAGFDLVKGVVYKTTNGGDNWTAIWRGDNLARYTIVDPRDSNVLYVSTGLFDRDAANENAATNSLNGVGILKSTDGGKTWKVFNQNNGLNNLYVGTLYQNKADPDVLLAGTGVAGPAGLGSMNRVTTTLGAYLSTDGGEHWTQVLKTTTPISAVEFSDNNSNIAYAGGPEGVYRSNDMGKTWTKQTQGNFWGAPGTRAGFPIDFQVDPRNPDRLFANNYGGGNFLSTDGGKTWTVASNGYTGAFLHNIAVNPQDRENVFVIGRTGSFRSTDNGTNWQGLTKEPAVLGGEWYAIAVDPKNPSHIIESDEHQGVIFHSTNSGNDWTQVLRNPKVHVEVMETRAGFKSIMFAPSNTNIVYAGMCLERNQVDQNLAIMRNTPGFGVWKSTDGGKTWAESNDAVIGNQNINMLAVDPANADIVYAATLQNGMFKTTDGGMSWQKINQGLGHTDVRAVAVDPKNPKIIYAGVENGGVYISADGGANWQSNSAGMDTGSSIHSIAIHPNDSQILFAGDIQSGVFRSENGGKTWVRINNGLRTRAVTSLVIAADGTILYAATQGEGVFRLTLAKYPGEN